MHFLFLVFCFTKKLQYSEGVCIVLLFCFIKDLQHSDGGKMLMLCAAYHGIREVRA